MPRGIKATYKTLTCYECGIEFEYKDTKRNANRRFCSHNCSTTNTGKRNKGKVHSKEVNLSKGRSGKDNGFYGRRHTESAKRRMSENKTGVSVHSKGWREEHSKKMSGKNNPFYGKTHSLEFSLQHSERMSGENNPAWTGGYRKSDYVGFTETLKNIIRERDGYICQVCGEKEVNIVHHIDYDKENNSQDNLVTVCNPCHGKTNWNREEWMDFFSKVKNEELCPKPL